MNFRKIACVIAVAVLFVSGAAAVMIYKIGDRVFDEIIEQNLTLEIKDKSDVSTVTPPEKQDKPVSIPPTEQPSDNDASMKQSSDTSCGQKDLIKQIEPEIKPEPDAEVRPNIAGEKIDEIKEKVTSADKMSMAALVFRKLSQQDIEKLIKMAAGGITADEKEKMKELAFERFTAEEINEIKSMYNKYIR